MSSPFSSFQEFSEAEGPIYTFANNPTMIAILLILCLAIFLYFLVASYGMRRDVRPNQSAKSLGLLLVAGGASLLGMLSAPQSQQPEAIDRPSVQRNTAKSWQPLALLGMVGVGGATRGRQRRSIRRRKPSRHLR